MSLVLPIYGEVARRAGGAGWILLIAAAWLSAVGLELSGGAHALHHHTIYHSGHIIAGGLGLLGAWQVMTAAMMLPGMLPALVCIERPAAQLVFIATYAAAWTAFAVVAFTGDMGLHTLVHSWPLAAEHQNLIPAAVLGLAAAYEVSPWKRDSLAACRRQPTSALAYSRHCLVSGWALMLIMFSAGVADLVWMGALALVMLAEKTLPSGESLRHIIAAVLGLLAVDALLGVHLLAA